MESDCLFIFGQDQYHLFRNCIVKMKMERRGRMVRTSDSTKGSWVRIPAKALRGICEQDTLKSTARGSQNKQNRLRHVPLTSVKKRKKKMTTERRWKANQIDWFEKHLTRPHLFFCGRIIT
jgi:hypothetical protein